ncbi:hypothetical protein A3K48_07890 [candidate division WOR-1 bacterium RIFOXYA12_FULL_52_29]|uniref:Uncharacterized protein n=1 Tax=candidate division WOR-1 bacterium RIFOXYC12_FULL_54_18 TaxID=1802584 RepID=A0A1F4T8I9_UNCSA|nr:MAG: hypothetical protein A3K44_07890 [candidate division WOR-1 bacterium RIFOXYA2_FULL_51_19]OGC18432.1 MAG: hypothetical protein A3K48_07890 [candidate division WOR-1 bacterium RIFOXYA12_FULL_52_29]OGC27286.1 MAG: hypothetical protein A3K32_07885 [candidate division WOR-1 bacterium RIFOXYB2_FULL_45_9]OGC28849.1 MAG: hypothetical protein A3K49_07890 [candidate division WOR-1 bacterium RIFOXYC12_FULL_54_18]OGC30642.1 MAG: hypothetical protein A2346_00085 [candidate division WOR-1 bacterium R
MLEIETLIKEGKDLIDKRIPSGHRLILDLVNKIKFNEWASSCISILSDVAPHQAEQIKSIYKPDINTINAAEQIYGILLSANKIAKLNLTKKSASSPCGPHAKTLCDQYDTISKEYAENNVFLDIPYTNYDDCETILRELLKEAGLNAIAAKDKLTSMAVLCKVCSIIKKCKYGITDISSASNSVSYEYGLLHGLGINTCLLLREESVKFTDIHGLEHLPYKGLRDFKISIAKWIINNIKEADKDKLINEISNEESLLQEKGELPLKEISNSSNENKNHELAILEEAEKRANSIKAHSKSLPSIQLISIPANFSISLRNLVEKKNTFVIFPQSPSEFPCSNYDFKTSNTSLVYTKETLSDFGPAYFDYFEINERADIFFEENIDLLHINNPNKTNSQIKSIPTIIVLRLLYKYYLLIKAIYKSIDYNGPLTTYLKLTNVKGFTLTSEDQFRFPLNIGSIDFNNEILTTNHFSTSDLSLNLEETILNNYEEFRLRSGVKDNPFDRKITETHLEKVKISVHGSDLCPVCNTNMKPRPSKECLFCRRNNI